MDLIGFRSLIVALDDRHHLKLLKQARELGMCSNIFHYTILAEVSTKLPSGYKILETSSGRLFGRAYS